MKKKTFMDSNPNSSKPTPMNLVKQIFSPLYRTKNIGYCH